MQCFRKASYGRRTWLIVSFIALCIVACRLPIWAESAPSAPVAGVSAASTPKLEASDVVRVMDKAAEYVAFTVLNTMQPGAAIGFQCVISGLNTNSSTAETATKPTEPAKTPQPADKHEVKNEVRYPIEITSSGWEHVMSRHTAGGAQNAGKSIFSQGVDIRALIKDAETVVPVRESNGYYSRERDAGSKVGYDGRSGKPTNVYRVITTQSGQLVTAYPVLY